MARERHTIPLVPSKAGLVNTGGQSTIPESSWWEARNVTTDPSGRLAKRPGLQQWGHTLKAPNSGGIGWEEIFSDGSHLSIVTSGTTAQVETSTGSAIFTTTSLVEGTDVADIVRLGQPSDGSLEAGETGLMDFRFMFRARQAMPAISTTSQRYGFGGGFKNDLGETVSFLICEAGIYVYRSGGTFVIVAGTDVDDGSWHTIEFRLLTASPGLVDVIVDDGEAVSAAYIDNTVFDPGVNQATLGASPNANGLVDAEVAFMQGRSGNENIDGIPIDHLYNWNSPDPFVQHELVVAGDVIYEDRGWAGILRPVATTHSGGLTLFAPFGEQLLIVNPRLATRLWSGVRGTDPEEVPAGMPREVYLAVQHQARCVAISESKPLRVYVSAANDLSDWTTEDAVNISGESFYFDIPDAAGERITGLIGDYKGNLVIFTANSTYILLGSSVDTYVLRYVSEVGCVGPRAYDRVGDDVLFLSKHGVHSLAITTQFDALATQNVSVPLRNLWQRNSFFNLPKILESYYASVTHAPHLGRTYVGVQTYEGATPNRLYEFNHDTNQWSGPWTVECGAIDYVLLGAPSTPLLLLGDTHGRVAMAIDDRKFDFEADAYTVKLRSGRLDGRTLDPYLARRIKLWRTLRLYVIPRGDWDFAISWLVDDHTLGGSDTPSQNVYNDAILASTFVLGTSKIVESERVGIIDVTLDTRGRWLEFTIEQAGADEDLVIVGAEIDFTLGEADKETV